MSTDALLARHAELGERAWPAVTIPRDAFFSYLRERIVGLPDERVATLPSADLYLACGCTLGLAPAISHFFETYLRGLAGELERVRIDPVVAREVQGILFERLTTPKLGSSHTLLSGYAGTGALAGWLSIVAIREAFGILRKDTRYANPPRNLIDAMNVGLDPELLYMRAAYGQQIEEAFAAAAAGLTDRERNLLRYSYLDQISIDEIGAIYRIHRATAARWVSAAQDRLIEEMRRGLRTRLAIADRDVDSILRSMGSRLDFSVRRYLAADEETC